MRRVAFASIVLAATSFVTVAAQAGETTTVAATFQTGDLDGEVSSQAESLARKIAEHLSATKAIATSQEMLAKGEPFTFDFEDGLQGWTLEGSAERVNTQILGGQWAIFGDGLVPGGSRMQLEMSLADAAWAVLDVFEQPESGSPTPMQLAFDLRAVDPDGVLHFEWESAAFVDNITLVPIPEPSTLALVLGGLVLVSATRRFS